MTTQSPTRTSGRSPGRTAGRLAAALTVLLLGTSGCSSVGDLVGLGDEPSSAASDPGADAAVEAPRYPSQFTDDGTYQSHQEIEGIDFVYTLYPTKATPRTNEWYPRGDKFFSFTLQAYDLTRELRDPFDTKRLVYAGQVKVTSSTVRSDEGAGQRPYKLNARAEDVTFDPEPLTARQGMLITSPKGALEMRNQKIKGVHQNTVGLDLELATVVFVETSAGSGRFERTVIRETVPIALFPSTTPTVSEKIPYTSN